MVYNFFSENFITKKIESWFSNTDAIKFLFFIKLNELSISYSLLFKIKFILLNISDFLFPTENFIINV